MAYSRDGGALHCLICGRSGLNRAQMALQSHERSPFHKKAILMQPTEPILYPNAVWKPLTGHSSPGTLAQRKLIVLHITAGSTMVGAFNTFQGSLAPHRVSAHFIIDRDGTIYQLLSLSETAWHASAVNGHSIGIEHVGVPQTLMCTTEQYSASALLVKWLCEKLGLPLDRTHVVDHSEASPADGHILCCKGALSPDHVVEMAAELPDQIPT